MDIQKQIEALIFAYPRAITLQEITDFFQSLNQEKIKDIEKIIQKITLKYKDDQHIFQLCQLDGGYRFLSKIAYREMIEKIYEKQQQKKLGKVILETLAIVLYKQPVTKLEIEAIRGVNVDYSLDKLLEKKLINIAPRAELPGRPIQYTVGENFLDYFGLHSLDDLPKISELQLEK